ncbi:AMP-binding protein [Sphingomonas sp. G-3-2-10]|nr:AMP-binding protein [Sphingomonas sp. G-3-2-10]
MLREHRVRWPEVVAVVDRHGPGSLTYPQLADRVARLATWLARNGAATGHRVLWLGQNSAAILELMLACAQTGAALCIANWRQSPEEMLFTLDDLDPRLIVWQHGAIGATVAEVRSRRNNSAETWLRYDADTGVSEYEAAIAGQSPHDDLPGASPGQPLLLLYTAGFSGKPAASILTQRGIIAQSFCYAAQREFDSSLRYLNATPLFHVATLLDMCAAFLIGGRNIFVPQASAGEMCELIDREGITATFVLPPTIEQMLVENADGRFNLKSLRSLPYNDAWNAMVTLDDSPWGKRPYGYGQTETMGYTTFNAIGAPGIGAMGRPSPIIRMAFVDDAGEPVPDGQVGEIAVRGASVSPGYWNRPEMDAARYTDGWRRTGDLGRREADGSISFIGSKGRLIKSAAENIYPAEVESCIRQLDGVADVAVIGTPDPQWTQSVKALVVLKPESAVTADQVIRHCRARIASYKKPRTVEFLAALPRVNGAMDYARLDADHGGGGYPGTG